MKVLISTSGRLKISGERPLDGDRWLRFLKYYSVPKNCNPKGIQAKVDKDEGLLYVVLPKKVPQHADSHQHAETQEPLLRSGDAFDGAHNEVKSQQNLEGLHDLGDAKSHDFAGKSSVTQKFGHRMGNDLMVSLKQNKVVVGSIVSAIAVIVGILAYLGWRYRS